MEKSLTLLSLTKLCSCIAECNLFRWGQMLMNIHEYKAEIDYIWLITNMCALFEKTRFIHSFGKTTIKIYFIAFYWKSMCKVIKSCRQNSSLHRDRKEQNVLYLFYNNTSSVRSITGLSKIVIKTLFGPDQFWALQRREIHWTQKPQHIICGQH